MLVYLNTLLIFVLYETAKAIKTDKMKVVDTYKGIEVKFGSRGASVMSNGTARNAGRRFKNQLDSIVYFINGEEFSFGVSRGFDYSDLKEITHNDIDLKIRQLLPKL